MKISAIGLLIAAIVHYPFENRYNRLWLSYEDGQVIDTAQTAHPGATIPVAAPSIPGQNLGTEPMLRWEHPGWDGKVQIHKDAPNDPILVAYRDYL